MLSKRIFYNILWGVTAFTYLLSVFYLSSGLAFAQTYSMPTAGVDEDQGPQNWCEFMQFLRGLIQWMLIIGLIIGVVMIIYGGIRFLTAGGDAAGAATAGKIIGFSAVGIVVIALAFALVRVIASLTGINIDTGKCEDRGGGSFDF